MVCELYPNEAATKKGEKNIKLSKEKASPQHIIRFLVYCLATSTRYLWTKDSGPDRVAIIPHLKPTSTGKI